MLFIPLLSKGRELETVSASYSKENLSHGNLRYLPLTLGDDTYDAPVFLDTILRTCGYFENLELPLRHGSVTWLGPLVGICEGGSFVGPNRAIRLARLNPTYW